MDYQERKLRVLSGIDNPRPLTENIQTTYKQFMRLVPKYVNYIKRATRRKGVRLQKPVVKEGPQTLRFKFTLGRKKSGELVVPAYFLRITYDRATDLYNVESGYMDGYANVVWREHFEGIYTEALSRPDAFFRRIKTEKGRRRPKLKTYGESFDPHKFLMDRVDEVLAENSSWSSEGPSLRPARTTVQLDEEMARLAGIRPTKNYFSEAHNELESPTISEERRKLNRHARVLAGLESPWKRLRTQTEEVESSELSERSLSPEKHDKALAAAKRILRKQGIRSRRDMLVGIEALLTIAAEHPGDAKYKQAMRKLLMDTPLSKKQARKAISAVRKAAGLREGVELSERMLSPKDHSKALQVAKRALRKMGVRSRRDQVVALNAILTMVSEHPGDAKYKQARRQLLTDTPLSKKQAQRVLSTVRKAVGR